MTENNGPRGQHDAYRDITLMIVAAIEAGAPRFELPWHRSAGSIGRPINASTGAAYRGVNVLALWVAAENKHFAAHHWAAYRQWQGLGAQVRKGERGSLVVFYKELRREEDDSVAQLAAKPKRVLRCSTVFNADPGRGIETARSLGSQPGRLHQQRGCPDQCVTGRYPAWRGSCVLPHPRRLHSGTGTRAVHRNDDE